jgi:hypothetical protein
MNPRELVDHIRSGPAELELLEPLRFRRPNPYDFNDFLLALRSSETIRTAWCLSHRELRITEDEWVLLVKTLGSIKGIKKLQLWCKAGSRDFHPFQAFADAVSNAHSLCCLELFPKGETFPRDPSGMDALANALLEHKALRDFRWDEYYGSRMDVAQSTPLDPILWVLPACPQLKWFPPRPNALVPTP